MRNNSTLTVLMTLVVVSALLSLVLFWLGITRERELRNLRTQAAMVQNKQAVVNAVAGEALEYSKKNPAIDPILESAGIKTGRSAATNSPHPATK